MPTRLRPDPARAMSTTAMGLAIAAIVCIFTPGLAMMLCPLGVIVALLSRDESCKLSSRARISIIICIIVFVVAVCLTIYGFIVLLKEAGGIDKLYDYLMNRMSMYQ